MGEFLSYAIESGVLLLAMCMAYKLFLAAENQHNYNRGIILAIYAVAFLAVPIAHVAETLLRHSPALTASQVAGTLDFVAAIDHRHPAWGTFLIWAYMAGMAIAAAFTAITWARILRVIAHGEKKRMGAYTLVLTDDLRLSPFSWIRHVVMSRADYEQCGDAICAHELQHIGLKHWIDLLAAQAAVIVNWFNPAAWMLREELMLIHEYQADLAVIDGGHDAREYQMLLIKKAVGARFPSLANSLNHSKLKKRITMMYQEKSGKGRRLKALALVPAAVLALAATSTPRVQAAMSTIANSAVSISKVTDNSANHKINYVGDIAYKINYVGDIAYKPVNDTVAASGNEPLTVVGVSSTKRIDDAPLQINAENAENFKYIVDGVATPQQDLSKIPTSAIESITVDKDNSQVLITTNRLIRTSPTASQHPTVLVDGQEIPYDKLNEVPKETIEAIQVIDGGKTILVTLKK